jgi:hypothetical protein
MAADHGEFAFRSPHQFMQIGSLGRDACGKATGRKPPTVVETLGIGFDDKREQAFAQSGQSLLDPLLVPYIRQNNHKIHMIHNYEIKQGFLERSEKIIKNDRYSGSRPQKATRMRIPLVAIGNASSIHQNLPFMGLAIGFALPVLAQETHPFWSHSLIDSWNIKEYVS